MTILALLKGLSSIAESEQGYLQREPLVNKFTPWEALPMQKLEPELQQALQGMAHLNDELNGHVDPWTSGCHSPRPRYYEANCYALSYLQKNFARCGSPDTRSYCFGWLLQAGEGYATALADKEPVALLALMYWGVLLEQISYGFWWAEGVGRQLVHDISNTVDWKEDRRVQDIVECARVQVGLGGVEEMQ